MRTTCRRLAAVSVCLILSAGPLMAQGNVPVIDLLNPTSRTAGSGAFDLTVTGSNFRDGATVHWKGQARATQRNGDGQLMARIPASDITQAGTAAVTVRQRVGQQDRESDPVNFTITATSSTTEPSPSGNPAPVISALSPTTMVAGRVNQDLYVDGTGFVSGTKVRWNGSDRVTDYVGPTRVIAVITGADLASPGTAQVTTFSPAPGGGTSAAKSLTIVHLRPTISSLNPTNATLNGAAFTLTVNGNNFLQNGTNTVRWNGQARETKFVNSTRLTAEILASDLTACCSATVVVETRAGSSTQTSAAANIGVLATTATATASTPLSLATFFIGGANNPERVFVNQEVPLHAEHSGFPGPTHWKSSIDDGRALRVATWHPISTPPRHTFTTTGETTRLFQYRRVAGSDTTVSNVGRDAIVVRPAFTVTGITPAIAGSQTSDRRRRVCTTGEVMTGIRWRQGMWVDAVGIACAGRTTATLVGNTTGGTEYTRYCRNGAVPVPMIATPPAIGTVGPGFLASLMGGDCDQYPLGSNTTFDPLYAAPAAGYVNVLGPSRYMRCPDGGFPIGLDVYLDQVAGVTGVKGLGLICAVPE